MSENKFEFSYTAPTERERKEAERLRKKYTQAPQKPNAMVVLRKLDEEVRRVPMIWGLCLGIVGTLVFGLGLTMILEWSLYSWGIPLAVTGLIPVALAYPVYKYVSDKLTEKHREKILRLTEEILQ